MHISPLCSVSVFMCSNHEKTFSISTYFKFGTFKTFLKKNKQLTKHQRFYRHHSMFGLLLYRQKNTLVGKKVETHDSTKDSNKDGSI